MAPTTHSIRDTKWADGLRGVAAFLVICSHVARSLSPIVLSPAMSKNLPPTLWQLPFLRCLFGGRASVAVFAVLSGYVNALKPIKQTRAGQVDAALAGVAKSAFRRTGRFVIPSLVATTGSWLICQLGGYKLAKQVSSSWIRDTSPNPSSSFFAAIYDLLENLVTTWTKGANEYDMIQWTLIYLLKGSFFVYLSIFATAYVKPKFRMLIYAMMYLYYWTLADAVIGINIYFGLILAELTFDPDVQKLVDKLPWFTAVISCFLIIFGMYLNSYPEDHPDWANWSRKLDKYGGYIFPGGSEFGRFYPALGANIICLGIMFNYTAKRILSNSLLCWMGTVSYGIYLIHAPLLRSMMTWMLFGMQSRPDSPGQDDEGRDLARPWVPIVNTWAILFLLPLWYILLYRIAGLWAAYVEPWCARLTNFIEEVVSRDDSKAEKPLLLG